jgi:hypothetical protein
LSVYELDDLQAIDERCREIACEELAFEVPEVVYHLVRPEEVYFAAANGLPARYSSARWGAPSSTTHIPTLRARAGPHLRADLQPHGPSTRTSCAATVSSHRRW